MTLDYSKAIAGIDPDLYYHRGQVGRFTAWSADEVLGRIRGHFCQALPSIRRRWVRGADLIAYLKAMEVSE